MQVQDSSVREIKAAEVFVSPVGGDQFRQPLLVNLNKSTVRRAVQEKIYAFSNNCGIDQFIRKGLYSTHYKGQYVVLGDTIFWTIKDGVVFGLNSSPRLLLDESDKLVSDLFQQAVETTPSAVVIPYHIRGVKTYFALLLNADTQDGEGFDAPPYNLPQDLEDYDFLSSFPSISFECLRRFYGNDTTAEVCARVAAEKIKIVDFLPDTEVKLTSDERKKWNRWANKDYAKRGSMPLESPGPGYTLLYGERWHRPATVLMYDSENKFSILLGMDEESYFGVELADNPKSVEKAFESLMPKCCRGVEGVLRQGEWFAKPVADEDVPSIPECVVTFGCNNDNGYAHTASDSDANMALHRDNDESSGHFVYCSLGRIKDGVVYIKDGNIVHGNNEHVDLQFKGWYSMHRNTAVRSYSVQGVD